MSKNKNLIVQDTLGRYLSEVQKYPLLNKQQERELAIKVFEQKDVIAAQKLAQANLRFVLKMAFQYAKYGAKVLDLIQEGNLGLMQAIKEFNPHKKVRLTTYAVWWIRSYIQSYLLKNWSMVKIGTTRDQKKLFYRLKQIQDNFEKIGITPNTKLIADTLNVKEREVKLMQQRLNAHDLSLDKPFKNSTGDKEISLVESLNAPLIETDNQLIQSEQLSLFSKALNEFKNNVNERERYFLSNRLLSEKPMTLKVLGEHFNISKERSRQIEEKIKTKLKDFLEQNYPEIKID